MYIKTISESVEFIKKRVNSTEYVNKHTWEYDAQLSLKLQQLYHNVNLRYYDLKFNII